MEPDELSTPLGRDKSKTPPKLPIAAPQVVAGLLALSGLVVAVWALVVKDPLGGEPVVFVATTPGVAGAASDEVGEGRRAARQEGPVSASDAKAAAAATAKAQSAAAPPAGSRTVTIIDGSSGKRQEIVIPGSPGPTGPAGATGSATPAAPAAPPVEPRAEAERNLLEASRHGPIPKLGADGARASTVYAQPLHLTAARKDLPRIAVVIGGLGISASGTADALGRLPPAATMAIAPYGADLPKLAQRARDERHEVLLQVPMEPFDYPDNDPGPQTLLTSLTAEQNIDRLHWLMSRFQGYVGVVGFMGARFSASEQALAPVLRDTAKRGLIYVDDGASMRSVAGQIAGSHNLPFAKTDIVLDKVPTPIEIDRALARLEMAARDNGAAVGFATAQPATVARIAEWAKKVESRGFVLVPITMVAMKAKSS